MPFLYALPMTPIVTARAGHADFRMDDTALNPASDAG